MLLPPLEDALELATISLLSRYYLAATMRLPPLEDALELGTWEIVGDGGS